MIDKVVGLDLSLTATGVASADGTLHLVKSAPSPASVPDRVRRLVNITGSVAALVPDGALVVVEGPAYAQQKQAGVHLRAGLWWHIAAALVDRCVVVEAAPQVIKKLATGRGNATKPDMRMALYQRAGLDVADDNLVDAWWLRELGLQLLELPGRLRLPAAHLVGMAKVDLDREAL